jgi:3-hydroxyacyl-CoA dehydrogenase
LTFFLDAIDRQDWGGIEYALMRLQRLGELLGKAQAVAAVHGYCLGAGMELAMSCNTVVASADAQLGLPESKVGLIPGGRGTVLMRLYNQASAKRLEEAAMTLVRGPMTASADGGRAICYLRPHDVTSYHPDRLITDAKLQVLQASDYARPEWHAEAGPVTGMIDRCIEEALHRHEITEYDALIGQQIKQVFVKPTSYEEALAREREEFLMLCAKPHTHARIKHMLDTGKPLRN